MLDVYRECQTLKLKSGFQKQCICLIFKVPLLKSETVVYIASAVYSSEWITVFFQKIIFQNYQRRYCNIIANSIFSI